MPPNTPGARAPFLSRDPWETTIVGALSLLLVLPSLALGAIAQWARLTLFLFAATLFTVWILRSARKGALQVRRDPLWFFLLAFWGVLLFQVLPLPEAIASRWSGVARLEKISAVDLGAADHGTISISPYDSWMSMLRLAAFTLIFIVAANAIRRRGQIRLLVLALIGAGTLQTLYGFSLYYSGQRYPPWISRSGPLSGVMGTFPHKNYFSGFLEMVVPVAIGFLVYLGRERSERREAAAEGTQAGRLVAALSDPSFFQQLMLGAVTVVMIAGIAFSLSRAGVFILFGILAAFLMLVGFSRPSRTHVLGILVVGGLAAFAGASIGMDKVILAVEDASSRRSSSWLHRWDISRHAVEIVRDFPLFGTGLGTSGQTFTRYQSNQHADLRVSYLHNDVLQLLCETGIVGWLIFAVGSGWFIARIARNLRRRRDPFSKWVGTGALIGVVAMLAHSLFEHNLGKVTSNGIVFTELLAIAWVCSRGLRGRGSEEGPAFWRYDLGSPVARAAVVAGGVAVCALSFIIVMPLIQAELALNRSVAGGRPDPYFFLPTSEEAGRTKAGVRIALDNAPSNHHYHYVAALQSLNDAEEIVRKGAAALLGPEPAAPDESDVDKIVQVLLRNLPPGMAAARMAEISAALRHLDAAVGLAPAMADYHFLKGVTLFEIEGATSDVLQEVEAAVRLAPKVPRILFGAGNLFLSAGAEKSGAERAVMWGRARVLLRESLLVDPGYAALVYPLVDRAFGVKGLIEVTPSSIRAYEGLYRALWKENRWAEALTLVEEIERLSATRKVTSEEVVADRDEETPPRPAGEEDELEIIDKGFDHRSQEDLRRSLLQRKALLLGILGRWQERQSTAALYRQALREESARQLQEVTALRRAARVGDALRRCQAILEQDWSFNAALLEAAELSALPGVTTGEAPWNDTLDQLYRLMLYNEKLAPDELRRVQSILGIQPARNRQEEVRKIFLGGVAGVLGGQPEEGVRALQSLIGKITGGETPWGQGHLLWYYLGL
jgi:O-antigen ligase